jgi:hypothetical protein
MKKLFLAISFVACASTMAFAQDQPMQGGQMQGGQMQNGQSMQGGQGSAMRSQFMDACGADMQNFCASAQSRDDRRNCVMANKDKFSASCKSFMAAHPMHQHQDQQGGQQQ